MTLRYVGEHVKGTALMEAIHNEILFGKEYYETL